MTNEVLEITSRDATMSRHIRDLHRCSFRGPDRQPNLVEKRPHLFVAAHLVGPPELVDDRGCTFTTGKTLPDSIEGDGLYVRGARQGVRVAEVHVTPA